MNLSSWMKDTITVASASGVNQYGELTYGAQREVKCRVEPKIQEVVDADGQTVLSDHEIAVLEELKIDDRIWLPGKDTTKDEDARTPKNIHTASSKNEQTTLWMVFL